MKSIFIFTIFFVSISAFCQDIIKSDEIQFHTNHHEYSPKLLNDSLVFCSERKDDLWFTFRDQNRKHMSNLYFVKNDKNGKLKKPKRLSSDLKTRYHEGPTDFNSTCKLLATSANNNILEINDDEVNTLGIFFSNSNEKGWTEFIPFKYNSIDYNVAHPLFFNDSTLIFVSDKVGGYGKADLYYSKLKNNEWQEPINLGANINSENVEKFPTKDDKGFMYFSSDRRISNDLDIYYSFFDGQNWSKSVPYSAINTNRNDYGMIWDESGINGYLTRTVKDQDKLFEFKTKYPKFEDCEPIQPNDYCFRFTESGSITADTLPLEYEWDFGDGNKKRGISARNCFETFGNYTVELNVIDTITGEVFFNEVSYDLEIEEIDYPFITSVDSVMVNENIFLSGVESNVVSFAIENYYWEIEEETFKSPTLNYVFEDTGIYEVQLSTTGSVEKNGDYPHKCIYKSIVVYDSNRIRETEITNVLAENDSVLGELNTIMEEDIILAKTITENKEIDGLTSSSLNEIDEDGKLISKNIEYNGLNKNNIKDKVYGVEILSSMEKIDLDNEFFDKVDPKYNLKEIESMLADSFEVKTYSYIVGEEEDLINTLPLFNELKEAGYNDAIAKVFEKEVDTKKNSLTNEAITNSEEIIESIEEGKNVVVYFGFDKSYVKSVYKVQLDRFIAEYLSITKRGIVIESHTDNVGNDVYNLNLSKRRANSVQNYLMNKNIDKKYITIKSFGEQKPKATNKSKQGRQLNRRVEIKLSSYEK